MKYIKPVVVQNTILDNVLNTAPSQNAVFKALTTKVDLVTFNNKSIDWTAAFNWGDHSTVGYATQSWVTGKNYLTSQSLTGYATESWVNTRGFLTSYIDTNTTYTPGVGLSLVGTEFRNTAPNIDHPLVQTAVPLNAKFTDTVYTLPFVDNSGNWNLAVGHLSVEHQSIINGTGFVKASGKTLSYDNTTYLPYRTFGTAAAKDTEYFVNITGTQDITGNKLFTSSTYFKSRTGSSVKVGTITGGTGLEVLDSSGLQAFRIYNESPTHTKFNLNYDGSEKLVFRSSSTYTSFHVNNELGTETFKVNASSAFSFLQFPTSSAKIRFGRYADYEPSHMLVASGSALIEGGVTAPTFIGALNGNATTATKLSTIATTFSGTYPVTVNVNGVIYSHTGVTINGSTSTATAYNWALSSDRRLKTKIVEFDPTPLDISYIEYEFKNNSNKKRYGVIAQDIEDKYPELVTTDSDGFKSVSYTDLLVREVAFLKEKINILEAENKKKEDRLLRIEKLLDL